MKRPLAVVLGIALAIRLGLVWATTGVGTAIVDEQHYATLAANLVRGFGFAWGAGDPTSIRPPFYPAFVAGVWSVTSIGNVTAVRLAQIPISLLLIFVTFHLGVRVFNTRVGLLAAAAVALYPSLLFSGVLVLSETVFTCLLVLTLLGCAHLIDRPSIGVAFVTGLTLGAAALTRSVLWPFLPVLWLALLPVLPGPVKRRIVVATCLATGALLVIAPWSIRNTRLQGTFTVVDTMGGLNLMMGNYEHTPEDRMWDAVSLTGDQSWSRDLPPLAPDGSRWTEGGKEAWAKSQAKTYVIAHPAQTARRAVLKFADFWGIERDFIAGVNQGLYSPPPLLGLLAGALIAIAYCGTMLFAWLGVVTAAPTWRMHVLLMGVVLFVCAIHTVVFGHPRYHLPLMPILLLYGAAAIESRSWRRLSWAMPSRVVASMIGVVALGVIWGHEILWRDADKIEHVAQAIGRWW